MKKNSKAGSKIRRKRPDSPRSSKDVRDRLDPFFNPSGIAVIGASRDKESVGYGILKNIVKGCVFDNEYCRPFRGRVYAVNPRADIILRVRSYEKITDIPEDVELAVISVPAKIVQSVMKDCVKKKVKAIIVVSAGFAELGEEGKELQEDIRKIAHKAEIPLIGPNCLGVIRPSNNLNASFAPTLPPEGKIAFLTQSGAIADSIIDWSIDNKYGFSAIVSYGNRADLDAYDFFEYLEKDKKTKAVALYLEGLKDGRKFMQMAKKLSKKKPIIALKAGRTERGTKAASSHTGSLAGSYEIYKAAFKQSNVISVDSIEELFDISKALSEQPPCENSIAIVTNGGGCGVLAADYCSELGIDVVELKESTKKKLDDTGKMHPAYSRSNPLDIVGDALPERYHAAIDVLLGEDYISGLIVIQTLQTMTSPEQDAEAIISLSKKYPEKPIICVYMGGRFSKRGRVMLESKGIPNFDDVKKAAKAMWALVERKKQLSN